MYGASKGLTKRNFVVVKPEARLSAPLVIFYFLGRALIAQKRHDVLTILYQVEINKG